MQATDHTPMPHAGPTVVSVFPVSRDAQPVTPVLDTAPEDAQPCDPNTPATPHETTFNGVVDQIFVALVRISDNSNMGRRELPLAINKALQRWCAAPNICLCPFVRKINPCRLTTCPETLGFCQHDKSRIMPYVRGALRDMMASSIRHCLHLTIRQDDNEAHLFLRLWSTTERSFSLQSFTTQLSQHASGVESEWKQEVVTVCMHFPFNNEAAVKFVLDLLTSG